METYPIAACHAVAQLQLPLAVLPLVSVTDVDSSPGSPATASALKSH
jgi:hypothetical protein